MKFSSEPKYFEPGFEYTSLMVGNEIKDPVYASVYWDYQTSLFNPLTWRLLTSPRIFISYIIIESLESPHIHLKLCPINESSAVITGSENIMQQKYCEHSVKMFQTDTLVRKKKRKEATQGQIMYVVQSSRIRLGDSKFS